MTNEQRVHVVYDSFVQGNIPAILEQLADDVEWEYGEISTDVPWLQRRCGRQAVVGFFEALKGVEFKRFEPTAYFASGDTVVTLVTVEAARQSDGQNFLGSRRDSHLSLQ